MSAMAKGLRLSSMAHRNRASRRFWVYSIFGFAAPAFAHSAISGDPTYTRELLWLLTLAPAFLIPLHYGIKGSVLTLMAGTTVFLAVQFYAAANSTSLSWPIMAPIYAAYGAVTITVGWFSQTLDAYFRQALEAERMVAIGQLAVTINHRANNALAAIVAESGLLLVDGDGLTAKQRTSIESIKRSAMRIAKDVRKIGKLRDSPIVTYAGEIKMIDLERAKVRTSPVLPSI